MPGGNNATAGRAAPAARKRTSAFRRRAGAVLAELLVAGIILLMTAAAVAGMLVSVAAASKTAHARYEVSLAAKKLRENLKSYVTEDISVTENAPGNPPWHLPEDAACSSCWALAEGRHEATALLPSSLKSGYNARMFYTVINQSPRGAAFRKVVISVEWNLP